MERKPSNPFLGNKSFTQSGNTVYNADGSPFHIIDYNNIMTVKGTVNKSAVLFALVLVGAFTAWNMPYFGINPIACAITGSLVGIVAVLVAAFAPKYSPFAAPAYSLFKGAAVGGFSWYFNASYPGIAIQAVAGTLVTFGVCLALYKFGIVKVTEQFRSIVTASILAIATLYLVGFIATFFGVTMFFYGTSLFSIGFSVFVVIIAAMRLFLAFDDIEYGAKQNLPKYMEWFGAMGIIITLVWLYLEILQLLAKLQGRK